MEYLEASLISDSAFFLDWASFSALAFFLALRSSACFFFEVLAVLVG